MPAEPPVSPGRVLVIGVDVGGTFTDVVGVEPGGRGWVAKVPSTPNDPASAVIEGVRELCVLASRRPGDVGLLLHGTTVATNALLTRRGARTALLTTRGFRDVLEIARQARPRLFDLDARRPLPLVPRELRVEADERTAADGRELVPLDLDQVRAVAGRLGEAGVTSVAVAFLNSYANPAHERAAAAELRRAMPDVVVSCSADVVAEWREYERTSTATVNAFVAPLVRTYLATMQARLRRAGLTAPVRVMQSNGGVMNVRRARQVPAGTVHSGLAAGAVGGVRIAAALDRPRALTLDMGGTSCDLAIGVGGEVPLSRSFSAGGLPIRLPALDVHTIGAGGGSVAYLDPGGALRVGPRSAGADPGPACYGRGGVEPTVTDANLLLGRLSEAGLLGGRVPLRRELAEAAVRTVSEPLGLSVERAAEGIIRVVNAGMARAMRVLTVERGLDPRTCVLVAFGGAGPLHAFDLASELAMPEVLVPPSPGVTSALGLLLADLRVDALQTVLVELAPSAHGRVPTAVRLRSTFAALERRVLRELPGESGTPPNVTRSLEMRYVRQGHELRVAVPEGRLGPESVAMISARFHEAHRARFGYDIPGERIVAVNAMVAATRPIPFPVDPGSVRPGRVARPGQPIRGAGARPRRAPTGGGTRPVWFDGRFLATRVLNRSQITPGDRFTGPLIVEQVDSTTVVPRGAVVSCAPDGSLLVRLAGQGAAG